MKPRLPHALVAQALVDRLLPVPERAGRAELLRILARGGPGLRIRAVRAGGVSGGSGPADAEAALDAGLLVALLADPVPGVRRSAAWALGWRGEVSALEVLWQAARRERTDAVRLAMAIAATRLGAEPQRAWSLLEAAAQRSFASGYGLRPVAVAAGNGPDLIARRWFRTLNPAADHHGEPGQVRPVDPRLLRQELTARLDQDPEDRFRLLELAAQQHPADHERIAARKWVSGRRESHVICEALGENGDPRAVDLLTRVLRAMDVDPGHGFAGRRAASIALGRIGDPSVGGVLARALVDEALDHEGRPGAGLGIQFPVRTVMIQALGEAGCVDQARVVASYLGNSSGSALGGFYLPAMDALWKLDDASAAIAVLGADPLAAANAVGVLAAMGQWARVREQLSDPRPDVARAARQALASAPVGE